MSTVDFEITHQAGKQNPANRPSRRPDYESTEPSGSLLLLTLQNKLALTGHLTIGYVAAYGRSLREVRVDRALAFRSRAGPDEPGLSPVMSVSRAYINRVLLGDDPAGAEAAITTALVRELQEKDEFVLS